MNAIVFTIFPPCLLFYNIKKYPDNPVYCLLSCSVQQFVSDLYLTTTVSISKKSIAHPVPYWVREDQQVYTQYLSTSVRVASPRPSSSQKGKALPSESFFADCGFKVISNAWS